MNGCCTFGQQKTTRPTVHTIQLPLQKASNAHFRAKKSLNDIAWSNESAARSQQIAALNGPQMGQGARVVTRASPRPPK